jgi:hypothetical protein
MKGIVVRKAGRSWKQWSDKIISQKHNDRSCGMIHLAGYKYVVMVDTVCDSDAMFKHVA